MHYDFQDFLNTIKYLDAEDIMSMAGARHKQLEHAAGKAKKDGAEKLARQIKGLLAWFKTGDRPKFMDERSFSLIRPLCEILVAKRQVKPDRLAVFKKNSKLTFV